MMKYRIGCFISAVGLITVLSAPLNVMGASEGWERDGTMWIYQDTKKNNGAGGLRSDGGKKYFVNDKGDVLTGWIYYDANWYFARNDGTLMSGWVYLDGKYYYMKDNGIMMTPGWRTIDGIQYYFNEKGAMCANQFIGKYYVDASGAYNSKFDIQKVEKKNKKDKAIRKPTNEEYADMAETLNNLPKVIFQHFIDNNWKFVCVTNKEDFGVKQILDEERTVYADFSGNELQMIPGEDILYEAIEYYDGIKNISSEYFDRVIELWDLDMKTSIDAELNRSKYTAYERQYLLSAIVKCLEEEEAPVLQADNPELYQLAMEIINKYQLNS